MRKLEETQSLPKQKLIQFLKNANLDIDYKFIVIMNSEAIAEFSADRFVHRMRVELSRMRNYVRHRRGRIPKQFKVLFISSKVVTTGIEITLKKSHEGHEVSSEIDEILDELDGGKPINV